MTLVDKASSYTEITVSGTGFRIIGRGNGDLVHRKLPVNDKVSCEIYRKCERFIVITGNPLPNTPQQLANLDAVIDATLAQPSNKKKHQRAKRDQAGQPRRWGTSRAAGT